MSLVQESKHLKVSLVQESKHLKVPLVQESKHFKVSLVQERCHYLKSRTIVLTFSLSLSPSCHPMQIGTCPWDPLQTGEAV